MGFGRTRAGRVGDKVGGKAALLQNSKNFWFAGGLQLAKVGRKHLLACVQGHHSMEGRELVRGATVAEFAKDPEFATTARSKSPSLTPKKQATPSPTAACP